MALGMLSPFDQLGIRRELSDSRIVYRETVVFIPTITSGSNFEEFTRSAYDITGAESGQYSVSFKTYRLYARVKIVKDTNINGLTHVFSGLEIGDYLMYFRDTEAPIMSEMINNEYAYLLIDGITMRPYNSTLNGVGGTFDVFVHAKKYDPKYRPEIPQSWVIGTGTIGMAYVG